MIVSQAIRDAARKLAATSDTARLDAEFLMAHALGTTRSLMLMVRQKDEAPEAFAALVERRAQHEPVAHILGTQEFYGREFEVSKDVLIPRGDSESVAGIAVSLAPENARALDCGTGSGALLFTLLAERPDTTGVGIDRSRAALGKAERNAQLLDVADRVELLEADWTQPGWANDLGTFDLIIANPPYVETDADLAPDVRNFEPAEALFAGPEGLDDYRILIPQLPDLLTETGIAVLEIGASQAANVVEIAEKEGFAAQIRQDLGGRDRAIILRLRLGKDESTS